MSEQNHYTPSPIDTSDVKLPKELERLVEQISKNVHDVWAKGRLEQGWSFGPIRDDKLKQSPCLVPYADLPEDEKDYDRNTSLETLRVLIKLGYKIVKDKEFDGDCQESV